MLRIESDRPERLAVNLYDLDRVEKSIREMLLVGKVKNAALRIDPKRLDETAVQFSCDLLTAACILDTLRNHDRIAGDVPTRCYILTDPKGNWRRLSSSAVLTVIEDGKVELSPDVFPRAIAPLKPPTFQRVEF
jgi:hypothetical protein